MSQKLFTYLHAFKQKASGPGTIQYKIGEIFGEIKNKISSLSPLRGYGAAHDPQARRAGSQ